jgi:lipid-A-disaccharide synthase-like uncharacterized protein
MAESLLTWRALGIVGAALFGCRWVVQVHASRRAGRPVVTRAFWALSMAGSILLLGYFTFGPRRDLVGALSNLFPLGISAYNLFLALGRTQWARPKSPS